MNKKLIATDDKAAQQWRAEIAATAASCNELINIFQAFQPWDKIKTADQFTDLARDPGKYYDETLARHIKIEAGGLRPDPAALASLAGLNRGQYLNLVAGVSLRLDDCEPCKRAGIKPGKRAVTLRSYEAAAPYMVFNGALFIVDQDQINAALDQFSFYAETPEQLQYHKLYFDLIKILNDYTAAAPIGNGQRVNIARTFNLQLERAGEGAFTADTEHLKKQLMTIKFKL